MRLLGPKCLIPNQSLSNQELGNRKETQERKHWARKPRIKERKGSPGEEPFTKI